MKKNKKTILIILGILLFIGVIGLSYSIFVLDLVVGDPKDVSAETGTVRLTYTDCASDNQEDCANITKNLRPGGSVTKTFKVENTGTLSTTFIIYFKELVNTFKNDDLVYKLENTTNKELLVDETSVLYSTTPTANVDIYEDQLSANSYKEYKLTITFINREYDQLENANATYNIKLGIKNGRAYTKRDIME